MKKSGCGALHGVGSIIAAAGRAALVNQVVAEVDFVDFREAGDQLLHSNTRGRRPGWEQMPPAAQHSCTWCLECTNACGSPPEWVPTSGRHLRRRQRIRLLCFMRSHLLWLLAVTRQLQHTVAGGAPASPPPARRSCPAGSVLVLQSEASPTSNSFRCFSGHRPAATCCRLPCARLATANRALATAQAALAATQEQRLHQDVHPQAHLDQHVCDVNVGHIPVAPQNVLGLPGVPPAAHVVEPAPPVVADSVRDNMGPS